MLKIDDVDIVYPKHENVADIPEILTNILTFVDLSCLICCTRVSHLFRHEAIRIIWQNHVAALYTEYPIIFVHLSLYWFVNSNHEMRYVYTIFAAYKYRHLI